MTENELERSNTDQTAAESSRDTEKYEYSGIEIEHRKTNKWLIVVYIVLGIWSVYYLIRFWSGP